MRFIQPHDHLARPLSERDTCTMAYVHRCIAPLGKRAIRNVETQLLALDTGAYIFPVSVNNRSVVDNSYVVSPHTAYARYTQFEIEQLQRAWLTFPLTLLVKGLGEYLKYAKVDEIVHVNNSLVSTNLYPKSWLGQDIGQIRDFMVAQYPMQSLAFRSLNDYQHHVLLEHFKAQGFMAIPSRQVYVLDVSNEQNAHKISQKRDVKADAKLLQKHGYTLKNGNELLPADFECLEVLYNQLYLGKYSTLNPQYTADFLRSAQRDGWLDLHALCDNVGETVGVIGMLGDQDTVTTPIFGYDIQRPIEQKLYRVLSYQTILNAMVTGRILNFSSGAAKFKRHRGAVPCIEYTMVYVRHLPKRQQYAWSLLSKVLHHIAVPIMQKYQL